MTTKVLLLLLASVSMSSIAQILLKTGMSLPPVLAAVNESNAFHVAKAIFLNGWVLAGLALYFFGAIVWLFVLLRVEVSMAYPFVGLGFILTLLLGKFVMGDTVTAIRILGTVLIAVGVVFVSWR